MTYEFAECGLYDEAGNAVAFNVVPFTARRLHAYQESIYRLCDHLARAGGGSNRLWWGVAPTRTVVELDTLYRITPLRCLGLPLDLRNAPEFNVVTIHNGVAWDGAGRELHIRDGVVSMIPKLEFPAYLKEAVLRAGYKRIDQERLVAWCSMDYPLDIPRTPLANRVIGSRGTSTYRPHSA